MSEHKVVELSRHEALFITYALSELANSQTLTRNQDLLMRQIVGRFVGVFNSHIGHLTLVENEEAL